MTYEIEVQNDDAYPVNDDRLVVAVREVMERHEVEAETAVTIVITSNEDVAALNRDFRRVNSPTDVLSFPADIPPMPGEAPYLGDLIIAYPYASLRQRARVTRSWTASRCWSCMGRCICSVTTMIHSRTKTEMWAAQNEALLALGISPDIVPPLEVGSDHDED